MKKTLAIVLILCSLLTGLSAHAQTVSEMVQSPSHVTGEYTSPSGRTTVSVDAEVVVPDVAAMPLVEVHQRIFDAQEVRDLADALIGQGEWRPYLNFGSRNQSFDTSPLPDYQVEGENVIGKPFGMVLGGEKMDSDRLPEKILSAAYTELSLEKGRKALITLQYQFRAGDNLGRNVGSKEDAIALAAQPLRAVFPDMHFHSMDNRLDLDTHRISRIGGKPDYGYRIYFTRRVAGVPVPPVSQQGNADANYFFPAQQPKAYQYPLPNERLFVDVGQDSIFQVRYDNPLRVGETLQPKAQLMPLAQVLDIFAKVCPIKYASHEGASNNAVFINRVVLGYMHMQMKDQPGRYQMVPVWDFFGVRTIDRERYDDAYSSLFTINAIDGTVIDRNYGY